LRTFATNQKKLCLEKLEELFKQSDGGLTQERYFEMQEQMGLEVEVEKMPLAVEDFPDIVINALNVFNRLGDRIYPDIGYIGKDFTNLKLYQKVYGIEEDDDFFLEVIEWLDARAIKKSAEQLKREYDKMKRKK
jgi:hypothetical protein